MMIRALSLILAVFVLAGCSAEDSPTTTTQGTSLGDLSGTRWVGVRIEGPNGEVPIVPGSPPTANIDADQIAGTTGCNSYFGSLRIGDGTIDVGMLGQTEMACEQPLMDQERLVMQILAAADLWTVDGDVLTIGSSTGDGFIEFVPPAAAPDVPLIGTTWVLSEIIDGDAVSSAVPGVTVTLVFDGDQITGSGGCNSYSGRAILEDGAARITELMATTMGCLDDAANDQESAFFDLLAGAVTYELDGDRLVIRSASEGLGFRAS